MNFLAQLGILVVIGIIITIIIKANKKLEQIYEEEEKIPEEIEIPEIHIPKIRMPKIKFTDENIEKKRVQSKKQAEESVKRSEPTMPVEEKALVKIEVLDERGYVAETRRVHTFPYRIGRNEENDLVLDDLSVSGFHAELRHENGCMILKDLGSLNKLIVNGRKETEVLIGGRTEAAFGNSILRFEREDEPDHKTKYYANDSLMEEWH